MDNLTRILFLAANPVATTRLRLDEEIRAIDEALLQARYRDQFEIKQQWAVRITDLQRHLLQYKPNVVHFSGHGNTASQIILEDEYGKPHPVSPGALKKLFAILKGDVNCVVLNACYSERQAKAIAHSIDYVIGMSNAVSDVSAIAFARAFYQALGYGVDIRTAFELGCVQIDLQNIDQHSIPKLVSRKSLRGYQTNRAYEQIPDEESLAKLLDKRLDKAAGNVFLHVDLPAIIQSYHNLPWEKHLSILMIDIDDLTVINKRYGRVVGDTVIRIVTSIIGGITKAKNYGRCGDDTFYSILIGHKTDEVKDIAENLRLAIQDYPWSSLAASLRVTCSIGIATLHPDEEAVDLIVRASIGLNNAKSSGRNQVSVGPSYLPNNQSRDLKSYYS